MNDTDRLQVACDLAALDVEALSKSERLAWERRLAAFFEGRTRAGVVGRPIEWEDERPEGKARLDYPADFRNLQASAHILLDAATGGPLRLGLEVVYEQDLAPGLMIARSGIFSTFSVVLTSALLSEGAARLARCEACHSVYCRNRADARYCRDAKCRSRRQSAYFARYMQSPKGRRARKRQLARQKGESVPG